MLADVPIGTSLIDISKETAVSMKLSTKNLRILVILKIPVTKTLSSSTIGNS